MNKTALDLFANYRKSQGQSLLFGHVIVSLMMVCIGLAFALFGARILPDWRGAYLVIICFLLSWEAIYTHRHVKEMEMRDRIIFHLSEWVAFAVALKVIQYLIHGPAQILRDLPLWQKNFFETFFTGEYVYVLAVMLLVWLISYAYAGELENLYDRESDALWDELGKLQNALHDIRNRIAARLFILGALVVILSILTRLEVSVVLGARPSGLAYTAPIIISIVYFALVLVLLSQTQFAMLRTRWLWQRLPISPKLASNWIKYGLVAILLLAVVVLFLPTNYSIGLFDTLRMAFSYLGIVFSALLFLITLPITLCLSLFSLFGKQQPEAPSQPAAPPIMPPIQPHQPIAWLEFLRSLLFWALFVAVIIFALRYYLSQNAALWNAITSFPLFRWIKGVLRGLWAFLRGANRQISDLVQSGIKRLRAQRVATPAQAVRRIFNLARMSPREKIIYFYVSLVELGGERGIIRKPSQTPYRYEERLSSAIPEIDPDLRGLTETFLEARYSQHAVDQPASDKASSLWERIKAALRSWKRES